MAFSLVCLQKSWPFCGRRRCGAWIQSTEHIFSQNRRRGVKIWAEVLGKYFQNSLNCCLLTHVIAGLIGSSQLSVPLFLLASKQLEAFSPLPVRHWAVLLQSFWANSVDSTLLTLIGHTEPKNGINLSFLMCFIRNRDSSPSKLSYFTMFSPATSSVIKKKQTRILAWPSETLEPPMRWNALCLCLKKKRRECKMKTCCQD